MSKSKSKLSSPEVLRLIAVIRESFPQSESVYTNGGCFSFHLILAEVYPDAIPYYDGIKGHVLTKINGCMYDITGRVDCNHAYPLRQEPGIFKQAQTWVSEVPLNN